MALAAIVIVPVMLLLMLVLGLIAWVCGAPIAVKQDGVKIGYVRWFTFYGSDDALGEIQAAVKQLRDRLRALP